MHSILVSLCQYLKAKYWWFWMNVWIGVVPRAPYPPQTTLRDVPMLRSMQTVFALGLLGLTWMSGVLHVSLKSCHAPHDFPLTLPLHWLTWFSDLRIAVCSLPLTSLTSPAFPLLPSLTCLRSAQDARHLIHIWAQICKDKTELETYHLEYICSNFSTRRNMARSAIGVLMPKVVRDDTDTQYCFLVLSYPLTLPMQPSMLLFRLSQNEKLLHDLSR